MCLTIRQFVMASMVPKNVGDRIHEGTVSYGDTPPNFKLPHPLVMDGPIIWIHTVLHWDEYSFLGGLGVMSLGGVI